MNRLDYEIILGLAARIEAVCRRSGCHSDVNIHDVPEAAIEWAKADGAATQELDDTTETWTGIFLRTWDAFPADISLYTVPRRRTP